MSTKTYESTWQKENDQLLQYVLNKRLFEPLKFEDNSVHKSTAVELYVTPECNLKCEYCYLYRYGDKLYPKELRNHDTIIKNLEILCEHFIAEQYHIPELEIFSGEIWGSEFSDRLLGTLLHYIKNGLDVGFVMIPSNVTFLTSEKSTEFMQKYIDAYKAVGVRLAVSASIDGIVIEEMSRPHKDASKSGLRDQDYYDRVFEFCSKNSFGLHPMVSPQSVKYWIDNHEWFLEMMRKYKIDYSCGIMLLEVRNDEWTQENIDDYLKFINYLVDKLRMNFYVSDEEMAQDVFRLKGGHLITNYNAIALANVGRSPGCTIHRTLHVRLGDLAIVPCHRLSYDALNYGAYVVENDKIVGIKSNNVQMALRNYMTNIKATHHGCDACPYNFFCIKGCFGAQLEATGDPYFPCSSVCNLEKQKIDFLIKKYTDIGLVAQLQKKVNSDTAARDVLENINKLKAYKEGGATR